MGTGSLITYKGKTGVITGTIPQNAFGPARYELKMDGYRGLITYAHRGDLTPAHGPVSLFSIDYVHNEISPAFVTYSQPVA